jgi:hypothetical protein
VIAIVFATIVLVVVFFSARLLLLQRPVHDVVANAAAASVVAAFVFGSLAHRPSAPDRDSRVAAAPVTAPVAAPVSTQSAPAAPPPPADDASVAAATASLKNVSAMCHGTAKGTSAPAIGALDGVGTAAAGGNTMPSGSTIVATGRYYVDGWGADHAGKALARAACLFVDGRLASRAISFYDVSRPDVATALKQPALGRAGYKLVLPPRLLRPGPHDLSVGIVSTDGTVSFVPTVFKVIVN